MQEAEAEADIKLKLEEEFLAECRDHTSRWATTSYDNTERRSSSPGLRDMLRRSLVAVYAPIKNDESLLKQSLVLGLNKADPR